MPKKKVYNNPLSHKRNLQNLKNTLYLIKAKKLNVLPRRQPVTRILVGLNFRVHNGIKFKNVAITNSRLKTKLGEYSFTRNFYKHFKKKKKKK